MVVFGVVVIMRGSKYVDESSDNVDVDESCDNVDVDGSNC